MMVEEEGLAKEATAAMGPDAMDDGRLAQLGSQ